MDTRSAHNETPEESWEEVRSGRNQRFDSAGLLFSSRSHLIGRVVSSHDPNERRRVFVERERLPGSDDHTDDVTLNILYTH